MCQYRFALAFVWFGIIRSSEAFTLSVSFHALLIAKILLPVCPFNHLVFVPLR